MVNIKVGIFGLSLPTGINNEQKNQSKEQPKESAEKTKKNS
jgi:hypothetical protein